VPQLSDTAEPWRSEVRQALAGRTEELERLALEMYARVLSVRDIEAAFTDERGRCALSKSAASQVSERLWEDYQAFAARELHEHKVLYLFVDGIAERVHLGQARGAVLAVWAITDMGTKVLLGLALGSKEDTASCRVFLRDLKARGLRDPLLIVTDGAPGLIRAVEEVLAKALGQRFLAHKVRNLESKDAGRALARGEGLRGGRLSSGQPGDGAAGPRGVHQAFRARATERHGVYPR
jgi:putative transposase